MKYTYILDEDHAGGDGLVGHAHEPVPPRVSSAFIVPQCVTNLGHLFLFFQYTIFSERVTLNHFFRSIKIKNKVCAPNNSHQRMMSMANNCNNSTLPIKHNASRNIRSILPNCYYAVMNCWRHTLYYASIINNDLPIF